MLRQLDLFAAPAVAIDGTFAGLARRTLAEGAWVDYQSGWLRGHDALFDELERTVAWKTERRKMYDRMVETPRLLARLPRTGIVEEMRRVLSARYGEDLVRTTAALYRDGNDSVAFHGDTTARDMDTALVATVSLGEPRKFLLKPAEGGASIAYHLGRGDLIVMGGTCQRTWRHAIPKVTSAGPRMALMFRPVWSEDYEEV